MGLAYYDLLTARVAKIYNGEKGRCAHYKRPCTILLHDCLFNTFEREQVPLSLSATFQYKKKSTPVGNFTLGVSYTVEQKKREKENEV